MVAAFIAQYKTYQGQDVLCIDTDPVNSTLKGYKSLRVDLLSIMQDNKIDNRQFDILLEKISATNCDIVIDNGASSFVALSDYLISNNAASLIKDFGHELIIHTIVTGGQALPDTVQGFASLAQTFEDDGKIVVWLNPYFGIVESQGVGFRNMPVFLGNAHNVAAVLDIPNFPHDTFGRDLIDMLQERKTFADAIADERITIMNRHRLKMMQKDIFKNIKQSGVI